MPGNNEFRFLNSTLRKTIIKTQFLDKALKNGWVISAVFLQYVICIHLIPRFMSVNNIC